jgi:hypothetical protein
MGNEFIGFLLKYYLPIKSELVFRTIGALLLFCLFTAEASKTITLPENWGLVGFMFIISGLVKPFSEMIDGANKLR